MVLYDRSLRSPPCHGGHRTQERSLGFVLHSTDGSITHGHALVMPWSRMLLRRVLDNFVVFALFMERGKGPARSAEFSFRSPETRAWALGRFLRPTSAWTHNNRPPTSRPFKSLIELENSRRHLVVPWDNSDFVKILR
jgi:hypothetical protein